ncbi:MAG: DUF192 domain-containing protein [Akkermansiaceae bacterium]|nr:DUF192 domain-containing protein [Armatimonadota bacterium]
MSLFTDAGQMVAEQIQWAKTPLRQLQGLIGQDIRLNEALLLPHCPQVHTAFLAYPIDIAFCTGSEKTGYRLLSVQTLAPWRVSRFVPGATLAIEMRASSPLPSLEAGCHVTLR